MQVIDSNGYLVGTVKDIGFAIGKADISLIVEDKTGGTKDIAWDAVQAVGDFVLIKQQPEMRAAEVAPTKAEPQQAAAQTCPSCGGPLTYIPQYQRWYCYKCQKYA